MHDARCTVYTTSKSTTMYEDMKKYFNAFLTLAVYRIELQASFGKQPHWIGGCVYPTPSLHAAVNRENSDSCRE